MVRSTTVNNFERAGVIWFKIWAVMGLTGMTVHGTVVEVTKARMTYSILICLGLSWVSYMSIQFQVMDSEDVVGSYMHSFTIVSSLTCSALLIFFTILKQTKGAPILTLLMTFQRQHPSGNTRSVISFFPMSCFIPFVSITIYSIVVTISEPVSFSVSTLASNCFPIFSFIFFGQMHFFLAVLEDGFLYLRNELDELMEIPEPDVNFCVSDFQNIVNLNLRSNLKHMNGLLSSKSFRIQSVAMSPLTFDFMTKKLNFVRSKYHQLFTYARHINEFFSTRVILVIFHNFSAGVFFTYKGILEFIKPTMATGGVPPWLLALCWTIFCFYGLIIMVRQCERVSGRAFSVTINVQSLSTRPGYTKAFYNELRLFSAGSILERLRFSPCDLLLLNNRLLLAVLAAIVPLVAILLQLNYYTFDVITIVV